MARTMRNVLSVGDRVVNNVVRWGKPIGTIWTVYEFDDDGDAWVKTDCGDDSRRRRASVQHACRAY